MRLKTKTGWLPFPFVLFTSLLIIGPIGYYRTNSTAPTVELQSIYFGLLCFCIALCIGIIFVKSRICEYRNGILIYSSWFLQISCPTAEITDISYDVETYAGTDSAPYTAKYFVFYQGDKSIFKLNLDFWANDDLRALVESMRQDNPHILLDRDVREFLG